jgi:signal transduction histidine kinase
MNLSLTQTFYEGALSSPPMRQLPNQMLKELQQAKGASLESETLETIGRMAQFVSHDLRNRLSAIYASVEFMSESGRRHEEREELLKDVQVVIQEMTDMLDSLLLFSKAGRVRHPCWGSLNQVVEHAAYMVRPHPDARDVDLVVQNGAHVTSGGRQRSWGPCQRTRNALPAIRKHTDARGNGAGSSNCRSLRRGARRLCRS